MRAPSGSLLVLVLAACVAARTDDAGDGLPLGQTLIIPLPSAMLTPGEQPLAEFYQGLLARLQLAYGERDLPTIHALLAGYRRDDAPAWARQAMDGFLTLAEGLAFEQHVTATGSVTPPAVLPPIGEPVRFLVRLPERSGTSTVLGGENDPEPAVFGVVLAIHDDFADGSSSENKRSDQLRLPAAHRLAAGAPLLLPIDLEMQATAAVRRRIEVTVRLLPGRVDCNGVHAAVRQCLLGSTAIAQRPRGIEPITQQPLATLRQALRIGDAAHFPHVFLAATMVGAADRAVAQELLIQSVRLGRDDQARVATAALRELTGQSLPIGDRERWLAWWQTRR